MYPFVSEVFQFQYFKVISIVGHFRFSSFEALIWPLGLSLKFEAIPTSGCWHTLLIFSSHFRSTSIGCHLCWRNIKDTIFLFLISISVFTTRFSSHYNFMLLLMAGPHCTSRNKTEILTGQPLFLLLLSFNRRFPKHLN